MEACRPAQFDKIYRVQVAWFQGLNILPQPMRFGSCGHLSYNTNINCREGLREGCTGTRQGFKVNQFAKKTVCEKVVSMGGHKEGFDCNTANVVVCLFVLIYSYVFLVSLCLPSCWILNQDVTLHSSHCPQTTANSCHTSCLGLITEHAIFCLKHESHVLDVKMN